MPSLPFTARRRAGTAVITVNPAVRYQTMIGFGAAMTDSSAWLLNRELAGPVRTATMAALFSPSGIDLNYVRIPMGATDYTVSSAYSYDDMPAGQTDPSMAGFSIAHDQADDLPALREMLAVNPHVFTVANPWSAPPWMKENGAFNNANLAGVVDPRYYPALARYFVDFIQSYGAAGVPIDAITPMNEPNSPSGWPGTNLSAADDATFIPDDLAPALSAAGLHPAIYGDDDAELADAQALLSGPAAPDLHGIAFHCYDGMTQMTALHDEYPTVPILLNECSPGIIPYATAEVPIDAARNWAGGVQLWNLALDPAGGPFEGATSFGCPGCTGVVTVDERTGRPNFGLNYYQYGQTTKYVQPGAVRIASTRLVTDGYGISAGVDNVAFQNPDGSIVLVAYNNSPAPQRIAIAYEGGYLSYRMAPSATDTFIWR
jgi:glucosylceramidase